MKTLNEKIEDLDFVRNITAKVSDTVGCKIDTYVYKTNSVKDITPYLDHTCVIFKDRDELEPGVYMSSVVCVID